MNSLSEQSLSWANRTAINLLQLLPKEGEGQRGHVGRLLIVGCAAVAALDVLVVLSE